MSVNLFVSMNRGRVILGIEECRWVARGLGSRLHLGLRVPADYAFALGCRRPLQR